MKQVVLILTGLTLAPSFTMGCGLDWSLPQAHWDGVEEHGYVAYWEKVGEADLGDGLVIPVNISFNSHRESSSPYLGKGWLVALLESHVEPIDENSMKVVMPDGWNFYFYRNGNTETWYGNAGWVGETNNSVFTITARCGWRIKFDGGKIQEIDSDKNRTLSYKYNGAMATEVDVDGKALVQVESNTATGIVQDLIIGSRKIDISQGKRPRIMSELKQNLVTGFDQSLSELKFLDGKVEKFEYGANAKLDYTLTINDSENCKRFYRWDAETHLAKQIDDFTYDFTNLDGARVIVRTDSQGNTETWGQDFATGLSIAGENDSIRKEWRFVSGLLKGNLRKVECLEKGRVVEAISYNFDERGNVIRESGVLANGWEEVRTYAADRSSVRILRNGEVTKEIFYDPEGTIEAVKN